MTRYRDIVTRFLGVESPRIHPHKDTPHARVQQQPCKTSSMRLLSNNGTSQNELVARRDDPAARGSLSSPASTPAWTAEALTLRPEKIVPDVLPTRLSTIRTRVMCTTCRDVTAAAAASHHPVAAAAAEQMAVVGCMFDITGDNPSVLGSSRRPLGSVPLTQTRPINCT